MKEATNILSDMKNLLTLGNSVSWEKMHLLLNTDGMVQRKNMMEKI